MKPLGAMRVWIVVGAVCDDVYVLWCEGNESSKYCGLVVVSYRSVSMASSAIDQAC